MLESSHPAAALRDRHVDAALAGALLVLGESQVLLGWHDGGVGLVPEDHRLARAVLCLALVGPLFWRRARPLPALVVVVAAVAVQVLAIAYVPFLAGLLPLAVVNYSVAAYAPRCRPVGLAVGLLAVVVVVLRVPEERAVGEMLFAVFVIVGTWLAGDVVHSRLSRATDAVAAARRRVVEQEVSYGEALAGERTRIARELHDVIAHSVSVMGIQAGAARTLMETDADAAREALLAVEDTARSSVAELQRLLTVLRGAEDLTDREPQPTLSQLDGLVARMRFAGLPVELVSDLGDPVPPGVDLAAFRIVQEALTNALKHAGTPTVVRVARRDGSLDLEVAGDLPRTASVPTRGGHGVVGMRERAQLYGGTLWAGVEPGGRFVVHAHLPLERNADRPGR